VSATCFKDADVKKEDLERNFIVEPIKVNASGGIALDLRDEVNVFAASELFELVDCELGQSTVGACHWISPVLCFS
jgi:hypothetical protein